MVKPCRHLRQFSHIFYQFSLALTDKGRLYSWGNSYLVDIKFPEGVQGNIKAFDANNDIRDA